jgi:chaperone required for assembly of F1-ATPase
MHAAQDARALARLTETVAAFPDFELAALHDLVTLSGSLVIGLAAASPGFAREDLWAASRIDESWQAEIWGIDDEAAALSAARRGEFLQATAFLDRACDTGTA